MDEYLKKIKIDLREQLRDEMKKEREIDHTKAAIKKMCGNE